MHSAIERRLNLVTWVVLPPPTGPQLKLMIQSQIFCYVSAKQKNLHKFGGTVYHSTLPLLSATNISKLCGLVMKQLNKQEQ